MKLTSTNPSKNYEIIGEVEISTENDIKGKLNQANLSQKKWEAIDREIDASSIVEQAVVNFLNSDTKQSLAAKKAWKTRRENTK